MISSARKLITSSIVNRNLGNSIFYINSKKLFTIENVFWFFFSVKAMSSDAVPEVPSFKTLDVKQTTPFVYHVELNRPDRLNAFNSVMWHEIGQCFDSLSNNSDCRAIVLTGSGKHFTAGLDLRESLGGMQGIVDLEVGRKGLALNKMIKLYQDSISSLENCTKPVIVGTHAACIGAGVDLITSADIRYCTDDAYFSVMEVNIGMAADVGTLQRLPKVIHSQSLVRELCYTGRKMASQEAFECGLISKVFYNLFIFQ